ncbi:hypothetical protein PAPYR_12808 [Paratrimastix pyriformis]|uniref:Uncharacterized protein n=1 Tax=Paratrimastix pyriformis TaxID=342808 RepID=A0ABQ8U198_9EUKA|nr:hypothetical protein PAPYR_12808 [Paratrimastix pyriformis]
MPNEILKIYVRWEWTQAGRGGSGPVTVGRPLTKDPGCDRETARIADPPHLGLLRTAAQVAETGSFGSGHHTGQLRSKMLTSSLQKFVTKRASLGQIRGKSG